ncbi:RNA polymerase sigma factor [Gynurincola endophyticus]|jgi:RNA polymerase sigma factor (sigma-70 family)|uniref:RNA polymerase sigma factor n=1 Tax=Gynurincola endophyticus TaxID=2479004 RepID=UPI000F8D69FA|nr:RNA polymerase sigma factor [Gynurincola endophyticus]
MDIQTIIQGCLRNQPAAQKELYHLYSSKMLSVCYRFSINRQDAEDMLQEGFIRVFSQIQSFQNKGSFEGWVRRIIVHTCINHLKKNKKFNDNLQIEAASMRLMVDDVPSILQAKQVIDCIRVLPIGYRTVLNLFAIEGYNHKEIAAMLDIEESTSRSQYTRAKQLLATILEKRNIIIQTKKNGQSLNVAVSS